MHKFKLVQEPYHAEVWQSVIQERYRNNLMHWQSEKTFQIFLHISLEAAVILQGFSNLQLLLWASYAY